MHKNTLFPSLLALFHSPGGGISIHGGLTYLDTLVRGEQELVCRLSALSRVKDLDVELDN